VRGRLINRQGTAEERTPWKVDRQLVRDPKKLRREALRGRDDEEGVGPATSERGSRGAPGGLGHRRGVRVDTDDEGLGLGPGPRDDRPTVAGTEIDDDAAGAGKSLSELADVHLGQASADHCEHARNLHFIREPVSGQPHRPTDRTV